MEKGKEVINEPFWTHPDGGKEIIMNTYITKQQVIDAFDSPDVDWYYGDVDPESVISVIKSIPAADVRPVVRGKWITHPRETWIGVDINGNETLPRQFFAYECPFCGFTTGMSGKDYNFCPNCGADMRGNDG